MLQEKDDQWFEAMKQEPIEPSYQVIVRARRKAQEAKVKKEFLEEHLPIIIICGLNVCLGLGLGLVFINLIVGLGQKSLIMSIFLGVSYLPLLAYSLATLYIKNEKDKRRD